jgi:lysozyme family protein
MPTKFDKSIAVVLDNEGNKYENDPNDRGGECKFGVTNDDLDDAINKKIVPRYTTIKGLTVDQAKAIYKALYYDNCPNLDKIDSQAVVTKILDMRVNLGPSKAIKIVQRAINALGTNTVAEDSILGTHTLNAINSTKDTFLLVEIRHIQTKYYNDIVNCHPNQSVFLKSWQARVHSC